MTVVFEGMKRAPSPLPPETEPFSYSSSFDRTQVETPEQAKRHRQVRAWVKNRYDKDDFHKLSTEAIASFALAALGTKAPTLADFANYVDTFLMKFNKIFEEYRDRGVERLKTTEAEDQRDLERGSNYYTLDGWLVRDLGYREHLEDEEDDSDFEPDQGEEEDDDEFDDDFEGGGAVYKVL